MPTARVARRTPTARHQEYNRVPTKTKADDPGRFTKTPHEYGDVLITGGKLGGALQRDLIYWIERYTWGDAKRPEFAKLSLSQFAKLCSGCERKSVAVALADLEKRGIIAARDRSGCGKTVTKMYKLTPENWKKAKPYEPPTSKDLEAAEAEAEEADDETLQDAPQAAAQSVAQPGKVARPQPIKVKPSRDAEAVTMRITCRNLFTVPAQFRITGGANGRIQVTAEPVEGEGVAKNWGGTQPQLQSGSVENKEKKQRAVLFASYKTVLDDVMMQVWGSAPDARFVQDVITRAKSVPVEWFERIARKKFEKRGSGSRLTSGILLNLADDAARAFELAKPAETPAAPVLLPELSDEQGAALEAELRNCPLCAGTGTMKHKDGPRKCAHGCTPQKAGGR